MQKTFLIAGLGNPEKKYDNTYHNLGFAFVDYLAEKLNVNFTKTKGQALIAETKLNGHKVIIAKPLTYMNLSGKSVVSLVNFFKIDYENVLIVFDDLDIKIGSIRFRKEGSAGTHNGMKSVIELTGTKKISRLRIGCSKPNPMINTADFVLSKIPLNEQELYKKIFEEAAAVITNDFLE